MREIAAECGVNISSITLKAKQQGWQRNITEAIKERAKAKIAQIDVSELIEQSASESVKKSTQTISQAIEEAADVQAGVVIRHRKYIRDDFERADRIESALDDALNSGSLEFGDIVRATQAYKALVDAKAKLIEKERQAFCIENEQSSDDSASNIEVSFVSAK